MATATEQASRLRYGVLVDLDAPLQVVLVLYIYHRLSTYHISVVSRKSVFLAPQHTVAVPMPLPTQAPLCSLPSWSLRQVHGGVKVSGLPMTSPDQTCYLFLVDVVPDSREHGLDCLSPSKLSASDLIHLYIC